MKTDKVLILTAVLTGIFCFNACFSPWAGDEGTLTFNFGENASRGVYVNDEYTSFSHKVILKNEGNEIVKEHTFTGTRGTVSVPAGLYTVTIKGYEKDVLRSYGTNEEAVEVINGQDSSVTVNMFSAAEAGSEVAFYDVFDRAAKEADSFSKTPLYVFITEDIEFREIKTSSIKGIITIIAETDVKLDWSAVNSNINIINIEGGNLTLGNNNMPGKISFIGVPKEHDDGHYPLFTLTSSGSLNMYEGVSITGHVAQAGAIHVLDGTFTMHGGNISNNFSNGLQIEAKGNFIMKNGVISGNTGSGILTRGDFKMEGGDISKNASGGVFIEGGTFTMKDGTISENKASSGGGVCVKGGTFTMNDGTISNNIDEYGGGGVCITYSYGIADTTIDGNFEMTGGTISNNRTLRGNGGGVCVISGNFEMTGGTISKNTATGNGGGVYLGDADIGRGINGGTIKKTGGIIYGGVANPGDADKGTGTKDGTIPGNDDENSNTAASGHAVYAEESGGTAWFKNSTSETKEELKRTGTTGKWVYSDGWETAANPGSARVEIKLWTAEDTIFDYINENTTIYKSESHTVLDIFVASVAEGYDSIQWYVMNQLIGNGNDINIFARDYPPGTYQLTVVVHKGGIPYSSEITFKVEELEG